MLADNVFHLGRVHIEAAGNDHLLDAGDDLDEAIGLHNCHVARAVPTIVEGLLGGLWHVEVTLEYLRPAHEELARGAIRLGLAEVVWVADAHLGIREGNADVAGAAALVERVCSDNRRGFREPVAFHE